MDAGQLDMALKRGQIMRDELASVPLGDQAAFDAAKQRLSLPIEQGGLGIPPEAMAGKTIADLPRLKFETGETMKELELRLKQAQIAAADRSNRGGGGGSTIFNNAAQRAQLAQQMGIDPNTPEGKRYILTGTLPSDPADKPLNLQQGNARSFAERLQNADTRFSDTGVVGAMQSGWQDLKGDVPLVGNSLISPDRQRGEQARTDFITAQLRKESGATIQQPEFASGDKTYIPQYGDGPITLAQKNTSRKLAIYNMWSEAGPAFNENAKEARSAYLKAKQDEARVIAAEKNKSSGKPSPAVAGKTSGWSVNKVGN
jgi:hypothetical protein